MLYIISKLRKFGVISFKFALSGKKVLVTFLLLALVSTSFAQTGQLRLPSTNSAYTFSGAMGDEDQLRIQTYIWGQVHSPGMYIVPDDTDLLALISLAKGPTEDAKLTKIRIVRGNVETQKNEVIYVDVEEYIDTGNRDLIPILRPGDTIIVPSTVFYGMERVAGFISKFATVLSMYNLYLNIKSQ
ncbi:MAG: SLBB domain-containing protein [Candidatus Cloacimonetes bacterium]|nr:SLBB domain-containing protein [Candidatus Cloacimonadota bacterium]